MTIESLKQKIATIEAQQKQLEAQYQQLAGAKAAFDALVTEMSAPLTPPETPPPALEVVK